MISVVMPPGRPGLIGRVRPCKFEEAPGGATVSRSAPAEFARPPPDRWLGAGAGSTESAPQQPEED